MTPQGAWCRVRDSNMSGHQSSLRMHKDRCLHQSHVEPHSMGLRTQSSREPNWRSCRPRCGSLWSGVQCQATQFSNMCGMQGVFHDGPQLRRAQGNQLRDLEEDPEVFEFRADPIEEIYQVIASRRDSGALGLPLDWASSYADRIRVKHPAIANHIDKCVKDARRYSARRFHVTTVT